MNPIEQAGIYDIPMDDYIADPCAQPSLSKTSVKQIFEQSPLHAYTYHPKLGKQEKDSSKSADIGSYAHDLLTKGEDRLVEVEAADFRTKAAREARDEAQAAGKVALLTKDIAEVKRMTEKAMDVLIEIMPKRQAEQTLIWSERGAWCRARPDFINLDRRLVVEYKTSGNANPKEWSRRVIAQGGYDIQMAMQLRGATQISGHGFEYRWLVQETQAPYAVSLIKPSAQLVDLGMKKLAFAAEKWAECLKNDQWPAYGYTYEADATSWALMEFEERTA